MSNKKQDNHNSWFHAGGKSRAVPRIDQSNPNATFKEAVVLFFQKYSQHTGYASRKEYWWAQLFLTLINGILFTAIVIGFINAIDRTELKGSELIDFFPYYVITPIALTVIFLLATILPQVCITFRRLHDAGYSGLFFFLNLVPLIGWVACFVLTVLPSKPEKRKPEWESDVN